LRDISLVCGNISRPFSVLLDRELSMKTHIARYLALAALVDCLKTVQRILGMQTTASFVHYEKPFIALNFDRT
jgi:hypothetical protein